MNCPYPGLRPFNEEESIYFKGRETHIEKIVSLLEREKFLMLTGASGDGKSSLVYAGLIPQARAGFFKASYSKWLVADFRPERNPILNFAQALAHQLQLNTGFVEAKLKHGFSAAINLYTDSDFYINTELEVWKNLDDKEKRKRQVKAGNLLIIVDQFEELFTNPENFYQGAASDGAKLLINLIHETNRIAAEKNLPVFIVCTMRSDYIGNCSVFRGLPELIGKSHYFIPQLSREEIAHVIEEPAILSGSTITPRLKERLLYDIQEGVDVLPVLQHALHRVWNIADLEGSKEVDLIHYAKAAGMQGKELPEEDILPFNEWFQALPEYKKDFYTKTGLENVLNTHADELYEVSSESEKLQKDGSPLAKEEAQKIIRAAFTCLTRIDEAKAVRNRMSLGEIVEVINDPVIDLEIVSSVLEIYRKPGNTLLRPFVARSYSSIPAQKEDEINENTVLDITHEALIRNWGKLFRWVQEEQESIGTYNDFTLQLNYWLDSGKSEAYLLSIGQLEYFGNWKKKQNPTPGWIMKHIADAETFVPLSSGEETHTSGVDPEFVYRENKKLKKEKAVKIFDYGNAFLEQSQKQLDKKKKIVRVAMGVIILLMVLSLIGFYDSSQEAKNAMHQETLAVKEKKVAKSNELAFRSLLTTDEDPTLAFRLAEEAYKIHPGSFAKQAMMASYAEQPFYFPLNGHNTNVTLVRYSPDGNLFLSGSEDKTIRVWTKNGIPKAVLSGHEGMIGSAVFSTDQKFILSSSTDKTARIWTLDGNLVRSLKHADRIVNAVFSPDGQYVLTSSIDSTANLWNLDGKQLTVFKHNSPISNAIFSPVKNKENTFLILTHCEDPFPRLWDMNGKLIKLCSGNKSIVSSLSWSGDGKFFLSGARDGSVKIWDLNGKMQKEIFKSEIPIRRVDFSPDGNIIAALLNKELYIIRRFQKNSDSSIILFHNSVIKAFRFSPDSKSIVTVSDGEGCKVWNLDGNLIKTFKAVDNFNSVDFNSEGTGIVTGNSSIGVRIWNFDTQRNPSLHGHADNIWKIGFSPDGNFIVSASYDNTGILWDKNGLRKKSLEGFSGKVNSLAISPDNKWFILASFDKTARVYDREGNLISVLTGHKSKVTSPCFTPDGKRIITCSTDNSFKIWKLMEDFGKQEFFLEHTVIGHTSSLMKIKISPDGKNIISASADNQIKIWDLEGKEIRTLIGHKNVVYDMCISPDGKYILSGSHDSTALLWSFQGEILARINQKSQITSVVFSADPKTFAIASSSGFAGVFDHNGKMISELIGHSDYINKINFSPDGKLIVTASDDGTARVWDLKGNELNVLKSGKKGMQYAEFSPDGKTIVTGTVDGRANLWPVSLDEVFKEINTGKNKNIWKMGAAEKKIYGIED